MNKWFAIFKTGKHTDSAGSEKEWTEADLDKIAESYDPTKHEAPIVIGHPRTNAPAFGWIEKLKRVGDTLYALPKQLANEFVEMVNKGLFKKRSISLYADGKLRHVGFLGAQPPAVKGLPDVEFEENLSIIETEGNTDMEEQTGEKQNTANKDIKELETELENCKAQLKALSEKEKEFEELQTKYSQVLVEKSALEKEIHKQKRETQLKEFSEIVDRAIAEGRLLPKMKDTIAKLYEVASLTPVYEFGEGVKTQPTELLNEMIKSMPKIIDFGESGKPANARGTGTGGTGARGTGKKESELPVSKIVAEEIRKQMNN